MNCLELVNEALDRYGRKEESLLQILQWVNQNNGYVPKQAMIDIASALDVSTAKVYSVASFYHYIHLRPMGRYVVYLCKTISCHMKKRKEVVESIKEFLKIDFGEMTEDKMFSLVEVNCLGQCDKSPAMMINSTPFGHLTPERVRYILSDFQRSGGVNVTREEEQR